MGNQIKCQGRAAEAAPFLSAIFALSAKIAEQPVEQNKADIGRNGVNKGFAWRPKTGMHLAITI